MSWSERMRALFALAAVAGLSGCFTPMYGEASHPGLTEAMKEVSVDPVAGRFGHYLVDDLITAMNGTGETPKPKYRLTINASQGVYTPTIESQIGIATSATVFENVSLTLIKLDNNEVIYRGTATAAAPYDRTSNNYADLRAARDAEIRLARSLSQEIEARVGAAIAAKG